MYYKLKRRIRTDEEERRRKENKVLKELWVIGAVAFTILIALIFMVGLGLLPTESTSDTNTIYLEKDVREAWVSGYQVGHFMSHKYINDLRANGKLTKRIWEEEEIQDMSFNDKNMGQALQLYEIYKGQRRVKNE